MLVDGEGLALETLICTYHGMRQLRYWALQVEQLIVFIQVKSRGDAIKGVKDNQAGIEGALGTASRMIAFRQVESRGNAIRGVKDKQGSIEGKTGGNDNSKQNGSVEGTTSSVSVDSMRVNEALPAVGSQYMHQT